MIRDFFTNVALLAPASAWAIAQITKTIIVLVRGKGLHPRYLFTSGGMPSAHSAAVAALATCLAFISGTGSATFAISVVLALIVMYDATDVRHSVGRQSVIINRIVEEIKLRRPMAELRKPLRELIGHTPFQVFTGAAIGVAVSLVWLLIEYL
jgi:acid phosphatase family membrane protein YuiD